MRFPEFIGGFISGLSLLFITLAVAFLPKLDPQMFIDESTLYLELLIPYGISIFAGIGLGFGLKSDEGISFTFDFSEQWPALIGAIAFASVLGLSIIFVISKTPIMGIALEVIASLLAIFGIMLVIFTWEGLGV